MPVQISISGPGPEKIRKIATDLRKASKENRRATYKALERSVAPLKDAARDGARKSLPSGGGLAERVASATIRTRLRGGVNASLRLEASQTGVSAERFKKARAADKRRVRRAAKRRAAGG